MAGVIPLPPNTTSVLDRSKPASLTLARATVVLPIIRSAVVLNVTPEAAKIFKFVVVPVSSASRIPETDHSVAKLILACTIVVLPITTSTLSTKVTSASVLITTLSHLPAPVAETILSASIVISAFKFLAAVIVSFLTVVLPITIS